MESIFKKFGAFNRFLGILAGWLILISSILITYEVIMRYIFRSAPNWISDISSYCLLAISFLPLAYTLQQKAHISVEFVVSRVSGKVQKVLDISYYVSIILFSSIITWITIKYFIRAVDGGWETHANLSIPTSWLYVLMMFGLIMFIAVSLVRIAENALNQEYLSTESKSKME